MDSKFLKAEEFGIRLEIVQGLPIWEPYPIYKHQKAKDLEIGPQFYLSQGVKDVVVFNPYTLLVLHVRRDEVSRHVSPVELQLLCGYRCEV